MKTFLKRKKNLNMLAFSAICIASMAINNAYGMYEEEGGYHFPHLSSIAPSPEEAREIQERGAFEYGGSNYIAEEPASYPFSGTTGEPHMMRFDPETGKAELIRHVFENKFNLVPAEGYYETDVYIPGRGGFRKVYTGEVEEKEEVIRTFTPLPHRPFSLVPRYD